jgi:hypothetical protein
MFDKQFDFIYKMGTVEKRGEHDVKVHLLQLGNSVLSSKMTKNGKLPEIWHGNRKNTNIIRKNDGFCT